MHYFKLRKEERSHFFGNLIVGVLIAIFFLITASSQWGDGLVNAAFDFLVQREYSYASNNLKENSPLYFVEITSTEYREFGEPLLTPRDRIADLVETAWKKGAPIVALDILLDRPDHGNPNGDAKLRRLLERMLHENAHTQIIFPVRIGADGDLRYHLFEDLFERTTSDGRQIFLPAEPTALASEGDLLNRFWGLYRVGRDKNGQLKIVWSVPLLTAALHAGKQSEIKRAENTLIAELNHGSSTNHQNITHINLFGKEIHLPSPTREEQHASKTEIIKEGYSHNLPYDQRIRFLIQPITLAKRDSTNFRMGFSPDSLSGKIVVIGNSSPDTGDILPTPVGRLPGMYLIGNAINTIVTGRMPTHMNAWVHFLAESLIIVFVAFAFLRVHVLLAEIGLSILFLTCLALISWFLYYKWGLLFNFIIPVVGVRLHSIADNFQSMIVSRGKKHHDHH